MRLPAQSCFLLVAVAALSGCDGDTRPSVVTLTWLSNTTWMIEADGVQIFADAALTRFEFVPVDFDRPESFAIPPVVSDTALVNEVLGTIVTAAHFPSYVLVGHGHLDHTIDLGAFARRTGAEVIGARTACLQAEAQGLAADRCRVVEGGEVVALSSRLDVRVIRWSHSGNIDSRLGRFIQAPMELRSVPIVNPETGGIGPAPWQGYPNGGGARAYLFRYDAPDGRLAWLVSDTGNPHTFDSIPLVGLDYFSDVGVDISHLEPIDHGGAPHDWLLEGVTESLLDTIDLWVGYGDVRHVRQVHGLLPSRYFIPHHWDAYLAGFRPGVTRPFNRPALSAYLDSVDVILLPPSQYLDRYELRSTGLAFVPNDSVQNELGLVGR
jgi:hypothetical protein